ncbi:CHASE3 domain-containing protein [Pleurocapsales cyanobacterium LEGE 06147]|nr:CHASE3 domain-containing protein [Pleurocapsales cyanobacterium LEGE 06147]
MAQGTLSVLLEIYYQQTASWMTHSLLVERQTERLLSAALDEQTSLRGYLLTEDKTFLEPYRMKAQTNFDNSFNQLQNLVKHNPTQLQNLKQLKEIYDNWQKQFAQNVLAGTANKTTLPGKTLFDPMRPIIDELLKNEERVFNQRKQEFQQLSQLKTALDIFSLGIILAGVGWNLWLLHRRVELPLLHLTEVGQAWRRGNLEVRLNYSSRDEIGRLAEVLDTMASEIRSRQELNQKRNQQLESLISALSHDLRTPLLATRTTLRPMLNGAFGSVSDTWREVLEEYYQSNENLLKLVETLLDVSRYEAGGSKNLSYEPLNWEKIVARVKTQIEASYQKQCTITTNISPSLPTVCGDPLEIQRVLQNLLDNAVRVSEPDRPIIIEIVPLDTSRVKVSVRDRGPGIAPSDRERLFHRFIQGRGRRGGAGLGLYLCRQIVEAHGGTINVESTLGEGSVFWFTLPAATNNFTRMNDAGTRR